MKFENIRVYNFENALRGMRNPKNSWNLSDSIFGYSTDEAIISDHINYMANLWTETNEFENEEEKAHFYKETADWLVRNALTYYGDEMYECNFIGPKDMKLAKSLISAGSEHRKFLRQIFVSVDITAPLYFFKELDTYKIGTVANSTSTMHKLTSKPITLDCFEIDDFNNIEYPEDKQRDELKHPIDNDFVQMCLIPYLEYLRTRHLELKEAGDEEEATKVWKELVRWLPNGWLQTRTVTMNYENLRSICGQRKNHKLTEWRESFMNMAAALPYAQEFIL